MAEYIEREAAVESFMGEFPDAHYPSWYAEKLKELPTADVAEVRHGRWIKQKLLGIEVVDCSECKMLGIPEWKWCPVCGAKMDGKG